MPDLAALPPIQFVSANGLRFAYHEVGDGPLVVLLHGFPDTASTYRDLMKALADAGYRAVAPYLRGYAPTQIPSPGTCDPTTLGDDLAAIIDELADGPAYVVGMDWGGTSIQAALIDHPASIVAAVVMNAAHPATLSKFAVDPAQARAVFHFWFFQADIAARAVAAGEFAMVDYLWQLWSPHYEPGTHLAAVKATLAAPNVLPAALGYYRDLFRSAEDRTFPTGAITTPTLSIFGADDPTATYAALERSYFTGPYRQVTVPQVGHWPHLERPDEVHREILRWFDQHRSPTDSTRPTWREKAR